MKMKKLQRKKIINVIKKQDRLIRYQYIRDAGYCVIGALLKEIGVSDTELIELHNDSLEHASFSPYCDKLIHNYGGDINFYSDLQLVNDGIDSGKERFDSVIEKVLSYKVKK
jgi:hypothetical protein